MKQKDVFNARWARVFRSPRTTNERRQWDPEYGRWRRSIASLPSAYDDIRMSKCGAKSWKDRYRVSKQWLVRFPK